MSVQHRYAADFKNNVYTIKYLKFTISLLYTILTKDLQQLKWRVTKFLKFLRPQQQYLHRICQPNVPTK